MREVLEPFGPLSASTVWKRVADVYTHGRPEIWAHVPAAVTGNPFVGDTFAAALEAWLLDQGDAVDPREPLYVLELGAGTGMFSHPFVTTIARRRAAGVFPHPRVVHYTRHRTVSPGCEVTRNAIRRMREKLPKGGGQTPRVAAS